MIGQTHEMTGAMLGRTEQNSASTHLLQNTTSSRQTSKTTFQNVGLHVPPVFEGWSMREWVIEEDYAPPACTEDIWKASCKLLVG